jgi:rRNA maturation protein Rpf1
MSKILLTGMSAAQASRKANARTLSFAGVLEKSLTNAGHEVLWEVPSTRGQKSF